MSGPSGPAPVASTPISEEISPLVTRTLTNMPNTAMMSTHFGRGSRRGRAPAGDFGAGAATPRDTQAAPVPLDFFADLSDVVVGVPDREVPFADGGAAAVRRVVVEPLVDVVEPVEAPDREAAVDLAGGAVPAFVVVVAPMALRTGAAVATLRTGAAGRRVVVGAPPAASRPGTVSAFGKPAT